MRREGQGIEATIFRNEFAMVEVRRDEDANSVRLLIRDVATGNQIYLDPLEARGTHPLDPRRVLRRSSNPSHREMGH